MKKNANIEKTSIDYLEKYGKSKFKEGVIRCQFFLDLMKKEGFELGYNKKTLSSKYFGNIERDPKSLKDKYDFYLELNGKFVYFEVSGTDKKKVSSYDDIWIRMDKLDFLKGKKGIVYFVHILDKDKDNVIVRVIKLNDLLNRKLNPISVFVGSFMYTIKYNDKCVMSFDDFIKDLKSL